MYRLGIDLGGTNIAAGVVDSDYKIISRASTKTKLPRTAEEISDDMARVTLEAIEKAGLTRDDIKSFGVGSPGIANPETGIISYASNLRFKDVPLTALLEERVGKSFYLENDANAAAYGEFIAGAGKGTRNFIAITLGTGVGGGIILNKKIFSGSNYAGGELGHMSININGEVCTCGRVGCYEAYASATALVRQTKQAMIRYSDSLMWDICGGDIKAVNGRTAFEAMKKNDIAGKMVVDQYIYFISVGVSNIINIFQPDMICIGGGISHEGDVLIDPLCRYVMGDNYARSIEDGTKIKAALLGTDAGIIGAAFLDRLHE